MTIKKLWTLLTLRGPVKKEKKEKSSIHTCTLDEAKQALTSKLQQFHTYIHTYACMYIHMYIHTYVHTYLDEEKLQWAVSNNFTHAHTHIHIYTFGGWSKFHQPYTYTCLYIFGRLRDTSTTLFFLLSIYIAQDKVLYVRGRITSFRNRSNVTQ